MILTLDFHDLPPEILQIHISIVFFRSFFSRILLLFPDLFSGIFYCFLFLLLRDSSLFLWLFFFQIFCLFIVPELRFYLCLLFVYILNTLRFLGGFITIEFLKDLRLCNIKVPYISSFQALHKMLPWDHQDQAHKCRLFFSHV